MDRREAHFVGMFVHLLVSAIAGVGYGFLVDIGVVSGFGLFPLLGWSMILTLIIGGILLPLEGHGLFGVKRRRMVSGRPASFLRLLGNAFLRDHGCMVHRRRVAFTAALGLWIGLGVGVVVAPNILRTSASGKISDPSIRISRIRTATDAERLIRFARTIFRRDSSLESERRHAHSYPATSSRCRA